MSSPSTNPPPALFHRQWGFAVALLSLCVVPALLMVAGFDFGTAHDAAHSAGHGTRHTLGDLTHTLLEWSAVCAAVFVAILSLSQYRMTREPSMPIIGMAMLCAGAMDAFHILAADGLIGSGVQNDTFVPFTWALCRLFNALILAVGIGLFAFGDPQRERSIDARSVRLVTALFAAFAWLAMQLCIAAPELPQTQFANAIVKRPFDIFALVPYLACGLIFCPRYLRRHPTVFSHSLALSMIPQIATQFYMAFASTALHDSAFNVAHFLKVVAYAVPLVGLVVQHNRTFQDLFRTREELSSAMLNVWQNDRRRQQAAEALQRSEERFHLAVNGSNDGIWDWRDIFKDEQWWSPRYYELLGFENQETPASYATFLQLLHPEDRVRVSELTQAHFDGEAAFDIEYRLRAKTGEYRWFHARGEVVRDGEGTPRRMAGSITDISQRKKNEIALRRAKDRAEAATRAKADFLANMSHEIRTPLNGVIGMAELLWDTEMSLGQMELVHDIRTSADSLLKLINNILDFSKIEQGQLQLEEVAFNLPATIEDAVRPMQYPTERAGVTLTWTVDDDVPKRVIGDSTRIRQVLLNLVGNAVKFTQQGEINIRASIAERHDEDALIQFDVSDTGVGIPPDKQRDIFERFQQGDSSTTRRFGGTGLGLAISSELVRMMGGTIRVQSVPREGSTFTFTARLQIATDQEITSGDTDERRPFVDTGLRWKVLLVDDTELNRRYAGRVLEKAGHTVVEADSGMAALEAIERSEFDIVLLDLQMPGIDGFETTKRIRSWQVEHGTSFPILAISAHAMPGVREQCLAAGMDDYLSKPVKPHHLLKAIESIVQEKTMMPQTRPAPATTVEAVPVTMAAALNNVDGDLGFLQELAEIYDAQAPELLQEIRTAIATEDWESLERNAHSLKGASGTLGSQRAFDRALSLERRGRERQREGLEEELDALQSDVRDLQETLHAFLHRT